ncbi:Ribokinase-like protein [Zopfia rhizophila CBS 207.26]|uniref:Ribokinase-like protein n=1 Tax=Zopfia rhizophila CBS 207.26 TaxID=1314779 RepID=A0A6A6DRQ7_9PEZI|nr:Ribokinase-like protein [Zopfia rhizophila CBS 207.26]
MDNTNIAEFPYIEDTVVRADDVETAFFDSRPILVIGDIMIDDFLIGNVPRVAPDKPIPVLLASRTERKPGGAANVSVNLASLPANAKVSIIGVVGDDASGQALLGLLSQSGVETQDVQVIRHRPTSHNLSVVAQSNHILSRIDRENVSSISEADESSALRAIRQSIHKLQGIIISDYNKSFLSPLLLHEIIREARMANTMVAGERTNNSQYRGASVITPNVKELSTLTSMPVDGEANVDVAATELLRATEAKALVITRGESGVVVYGGGSRKGVISAPLIDDAVEDVSGAGDTFAAAFGLAYFNGFDPFQSAVVGTVAASLVVRKRSTGSVSFREVLEYLSAREKPHTPGFRGTAEKMVRLAACGYVRYLEEAKFLGGTLVLGLNSDGSIKRLKGCNRPILEHALRARVLSALACIDFVVVFEEDTLARLIDAIRLDILKFGGYVKLMSFVDGVSTTSILTSILDCNHAQS